MSDGGGGSRSSRNYVVHVLEAQNVPLGPFEPVRLSWQYATQQGTSPVVYVNQDLTAAFNLRIPLRLLRTAEHTGEPPHSLRICVQYGASWRTLDELTLALGVEEPANGRLSVTSGKGIVFALELESKLPGKRLPSPPVQLPSSRTNRTILDLEQRLCEVTKQLRLTQQKCAALRGDQGLSSSFSTMQHSSMDVRRPRPRAPSLNVTGTTSAPLRPSLSPMHSRKHPVVPFTPKSAEGPCTCCVS